MRVAANYSAHSGNLHTPSRNPRPQDFRLQKPCISSTCIVDVANLAQLTGKQVSPQESNDLEFGLLVFHRSA
jgi:hypothetical protein